MSTTNKKSTPNSKSNKLRTPDPVLTIAVSSRALFDFEEEHKIFKEKGEGEYMKIQKERVEQFAKPGKAFQLAKKFLSMNTDGPRRVEIVVLSRTDPFTGLRVFKSIQEHKLGINVGCFTRGKDQFRYLKALGADLFLSAHDADVRDAVVNNVPAAHVKQNHKISSPDANSDSDSSRELRIAFDGDSVIFNDEADKVNENHGLDEFTRSEQEKCKIPLEPGPMKKFLSKLNNLKSIPDLPISIRTALVTARDISTYARPIQTLDEWGIEMDEAVFLSGKEKRKFIEAFNADFFFDDKPSNLEGIEKAGHVPPV